jgi:hypothetical protein
MALTKTQWNTILRDFDAAAMNSDVLFHYNLEMLEEAERLYGERAAELRAKASKTTAALVDSLCSVGRVAR